MPTYGFDETVTEAEWSFAHAPATGRGVVYSSSDWQVAAVPGLPRVRISRGTGQAAGVRHVLAADVTLDLSKPVSGGRWYLVVATYDWPNKSVTFRSIAHTTTGDSSGSLAPTFMPTSLASRPGDLWDQPLAFVWLHSGSKGLKITDLRLGLGGKPANSAVFRQFKRESDNLIDTLATGFGSNSSIIDRTFLDYPRGTVLISVRATLRSSSAGGAAGNMRVEVNGENRSEDSNHFYGTEFSEWTWWDGYKHPGGDLRVQVLNGALNGLVHRNGTFMTLQWLHGENIYD